jgi:hypothetical protein
MVRDVSGVRAGAPNCTRFQELRAHCVQVRRPHIGAMIPPKFVARRRLDASWYIEITWPNGRLEEVGGFLSAAAAEAEIKGRLEAFLDGEKRHGLPLPASRLKALAGP